MYRKLFIVTNIYHLTVSMGQESGHNLEGPPGPSLTAAIEVPVRAAVTAGPTRGGPAPKLTQRSVGRNSFPRGLLDRGPPFLAGCWLVVFLSFLPGGPLSRGAHTMAVGYDQPTSERAREVEQDGSRSISVT